MNTHNIRKVRASLKFVFSARMLVSVVATPLGCLKSKFTTWTYRNTQRSIGPVALSSCTVQIQVKLSVQLLQYHGLTASL